MARSYHKAQAEFMRACDHPQFIIRDLVDNMRFREPIVRNAIHLYSNLIDEESRVELRKNLHELVLHATNGGEMCVNSYLQVLTLLADDIGDTLYVVNGLANTLGLWPILDAIFMEIHRANMTKVGKNGKVIRRADGKILKPEDWTPPNILDIITQEYKHPYIRNEHWTDAFLAAKHRIFNENRLAQITNNPNPRALAAELRAAAQELEDTADAVDYRVDKIREETGLIG